MNFLTEHGIDQYRDLSARIEEITTASEQAANALKDAERRLSDMALLIKDLTTYQKTRPAYDAFRKARDKDGFRAAHESVIILHEAAARALRKAQIGDRLPDIASLQAEYVKLNEQKEALATEYGKRKRQAKEYGVIKKNVDSLLRMNRAPEREREPGRG